MSEQADKWFLKENPSYSIVESRPREGETWSADVVHYHIKFVKPGDPNLYLQIWLFERGDSEWIVRERSEPIQITQ